MDIEKVIEKNKRNIVADFSFCPRFAHSKHRKLLLAFAA